MLPLKISDVFFLLNLWVYSLAKTFPYVSFQGQTLANHSYVNLSLVGNDITGSNSVECHTDLSTCCSNQQGSHRGDWYFPNGTRLEFVNDGFDIYEVRNDEKVCLRRHNEAISSGIYHCDIPTSSLDEDDVNIRDTVYVGLYPGGGKMLHCKR